MSITTPDERISEYNPVVATTNFAAGYPVFDNSDISVFVDGVERVDFTVSATYISSISNDAQVVFNPGITGNVKVVGLRDPRRNSRFQDGVPIPTRDQNTALDSIVASVQELARDVKRAVKVGFGILGFNIDTTDMVDGTVLMVQGDKLVSGPTAPDVANAQENAASAAASAVIAEKWADNPLNAAVVPGRFSAMHWALKALEWAETGVAGVSSFNGRSGTVTPLATDYPSKQDATHAATSKAAIDDADEFNIADSTAGFGVKKSMLSQLVSSIFKLGRTIPNAVFASTSFAWKNAGGYAASIDTSAHTANRAAYWPNWGLDFSLIPRIAPFVSPLVAFSVGAGGNYAHGLGAKPRRYKAYWRCRVAEQGFTVGMEIEGRTDHASTTNGWGILVWADATTIYYRCGNTGLLSLNPVTGAAVTLTNSAWDFFVEAWP